MVFNSGFILVKALFITGNNTQVANADPIIQYRYIVKTILCLIKIQAISKKIGTTKINLNNQLITLVKRAHLYSNNANKLETTKETNNIVSSSIKKLKTIDVCFKFNILNILSIIGRQPL
ncbi:Uncharacterised protein [Chlamydia trachomatis]|nr:Uncharacterised protein [Chlamydia trachomatis]